LGVYFIAEGTERRNTFGRSTQKQRRSYYPGSFGIVTRLEAKGGTDLKMKRPTLLQNMLYETVNFSVLKTLMKCPNLMES
jgi:hypothetical protein